LSRCLWLNMSLDCHVGQSKWPEFPSVKMTQIPFSQNDPNSLHCLPYQPKSNHYQSPWHLPDCTIAGWCDIMELPVEYSEWWWLGPSFSQTGQETRSWDENKMQNKKGTELVSLSILVFKGISHWKGVRKTTRYKQTKTLKGCKIDNKKWFWIAIWSMTNYNLEWL
jgi:hypothetical protein